MAEEAIAARLAACLRADGPGLLASLIRLAGDFERAEDALQEAGLRALEHWRSSGVPDKPGAWLNTVARRIVLDGLRRAPPQALDDTAADAPEPDASGIGDDRLRLLFTCCHPALAPAARCALALRTLGGLTTREIARAWLEPEATTAQRIVRAKAKIRAAGIAYEVPTHAFLPQRLAAVLEVLYLIFNEGHLGTDSEALQRPDLAAEAIRLARLAVQLLPEVAEARALLALMLLTDARRGARVDSAGAMVPLEAQDRVRWNRQQVAAGMRLLDGAFAQARARREAPGPYALQAAIAAVHCSAASAADTDWTQIALLYGALLQQAPSAVVELNAAVAHAMAFSAEEALDWMAGLEAGGELAGYHLLPAAQGDLLRRLGRRDEAAQRYREALTRARNAAERGYLQRRLAGCEPAAGA